MHIRELVSTDGEKVLVNFDKINLVQPNTNGSIIHLDCGHRITVTKTVEDIQSYIEAIGLNAR